MPVWEYLTEMVYFRSAVIDTLLVNVDLVDVDSVV